MTAQSIEDRDALDLARRFINPLDPLDSRDPEARVRLGGAAARGHAR